MTHPQARVAESLLAAAHALETTKTGADVRVAVRDGLLRLEFHLDTLAKELARDPAEPGAFEPALRRRAERVEAELREVLLSAWAMLPLGDDQLATMDDAQRLARRIRDVEHDEVTLVFDQLLMPQGID